MSWHIVSNPKYFIGFVVCSAVLLHIQSICTRCVSVLGKFEDLIHEAKAKDITHEAKAKAKDYTCRLSSRILEAKDMSSRTPSLVTNIRTIRR